MAASFVYFFLPNVFGLTTLYFYIPGPYPLFLYSIPGLFIGIKTEK